MAGPTVNIIADPSGARLQAPTSNAALELADSLSGVNSALKPLLGSIAQKLSADQGEKAQRDALVTHGEALGDAVREGKLEPTQNPWYIKQYKQASTAVAVQGQATDVLADSQTWGERNDPQAYAAKFHEEMGKIGQQYQDPDELHAFNNVAAQVTQQALAQNTSYNVQRINAEHQQAMGGLTTTTILGTSASNGGKPTAEQVFASIAPLREQYIATGGTKSDWDMLAINSVVAAAQNSGDASLLDVLDKPAAPGEMPLANISDPTGKPVASFLAQQRYDIERSAQAKGTEQIKALKFQAEVQGQKGYQDFWSSSLAPAFLQDNVSRDQITSYLATQGYSPQAQQATLSLLAKDASANASLVKNASNDAQGFDLYVRANRDGFTPKLEAEIAERVRTGTMDRAQADSLIGAATARSNHLESENRADARQAKSDARAAQADARRTVVEQRDQLNQHRTRMIGSISTALQANKDKALLDPATRATITKGAMDAEGAWLLAHPEDTVGASAKADEYLNNYLNARNARRLKLQPGAGSSGNQNTRR